ncbi:JmjC domain-containing protein [Zavarzinia sp. CC-PAN008]|uniref:JmjC domain-containing protein n=1 Tax=Zavarzinia sp. CC-PAN008 TaxID=3243332 RepID=UPI003F742D37
MIADLADLFAPHDPALLHQIRRARQRLHLKTDRTARFQALLPWLTLQSLVTLDRLMSGEVLATRDGKPLPLEALTVLHEDRATRTLRHENLHALGLMGFSLAIAGLDGMVPAWAALGALLERRTRTSVSVNCYVSFAKGGAFSPHSDPHDVLVVQVHGTKRWSCFGRGGHAGQGIVHLKSRDDLPAPEWEGTLEPGDLLFVPRGDIHVAAVTDGPSVHVTLGLRAPRGDTLLHWLGGQSLTHDVLARDIDPLAPVAERRAREAELRAALHDLVDGLDLDAFLAAEDMRRQAKRPLNFGLIEALAPTTQVQPALVRCGSLLRETGRVRAGALDVAVNEDECAVLALLLERDTLDLAGLAQALPAMAADQVRRAVAGLARKSLVFLFERAD